MDRRDRYGTYGSEYPEHQIDLDKMQITFLELQDENEEYLEECPLPMKFSVCGTCSGKGTHVNPSIDAHGLTQEDFYEDPDFAEEYFSGAYNVGCYECGGQRVTPVIDYKRIENFGTDLQKKIVELVDNWVKDYWDGVAISEAERRMGA